MKYGQLEYYNDELKQWIRVIEFNKEQLSETARQVNVILNFPIISLPKQKSANHLIRKLIVQEQQLSYLITDITGQRHILKTTMLTPNGIQGSIYEQQEALRAKMMHCEMNMIKSKYECAFFLSSFFQLDPSPLHA